MITMIARVQGSIIHICWMVRVRIHACSVRLEHRDKVPRLMLMCYICLCGVVVSRDLFFYQVCCNWHLSVLDYTSVCRPYLPKAALLTVRTLHCDSRRTVCTLYGSPTERMITGFSHTESLDVPFCTPYTLPGRAVSSVSTLSLSGASTSAYARAEPLRPRLSFAWCCGALPLWLIHSSLSNPGRPRRRILGRVEGDTDAADSLILL